MDHAPELLRLLVVVFGVASAVIVVFSRLSLPAVAGLIAAGIVLGPAGLGVIHEPDRIALLADVGVVLLLFTLGLEFSLARLRTLWRFLVLGGASQVLITTAAAAGIAALLGLPAGAAVFCGCVVALSSTAIVLRGLAERRELDSLHGRLIVGVLVFQDLCVVPMMLAVPFLAGRGEGGALGIATFLLKAVAVVAGVVVASRWVAPRALGVVARTRNREAFMMTTVVACVGVAWLTSLAGLSPALGAFLAGIVVAETEYGHQAMADILPFRDTLMALFFVSLGMLLDRSVVMDRWPELLGLTGGMVLLKAAIVAGVAAVLRLPVRVAVTAGLALSQVGEFSFVLAREGQSAGLLEVRDMDILLNAAVVTMLLSPVFVRLAPHVVEGVGVLRPLGRLLGYRPVEEAPEEAVRAVGHVVVGGYGIGGRILAAALRRSAVPYVVVELNPDSVREGARRGDQVFYGDTTAREVLEAAGIDRAAAVVLLLGDRVSTAAAVRRCRDVAPEVPVFARARFLADADDLRTAGAAEAAAEEVEGSLAVLRDLYGALGRGAEETDLRVAETRRDEGLRRERRLPPGARIS